MEHESPDRSEIAHGAKLIVLGIGGLTLLYLLAAPLVHYAAVVACGVILGIALWSVAGALARRAHVPYPLALFLVVAGVIGAVVAFGWWTGPRLVAQLDELRGAVGEGIERGREWLASTSLGRRALESVGGMNERLSERSSDVMGSVRRGVESGIGAVTQTLIVIALGVFFASTPGKYVDGLLLLAPKPRRARLRDVVRVTAETLRTWLAARLFLMVIVGTAFGIALALLGVPLALPIGVLTGALAFIPFIGALLALLPAVAVAFAISPETALHVLLVYLGIQLVESNLLDPLVESHAVRLPPALVVLAQLVSVVYFGAIGVLISTPLLVVVVVVVRMLYVQDVLGEPAPERREHTPLLHRLRRRIA